MTEDEAKRYPVGARVSANGCGEGTVTRYEDEGYGVWRVWALYDDNQREMYSFHPTTLTLISVPKTGTEQWFDEKLTPKQEVKKEWEPDKGINWEAHKGFMRNL